MADSLSLEVLQHNDKDFRSRAGKCISERLDVKQRKKKRPKQNPKNTDINML